MTLFPGWNESFLNKFGIVSECMCPQILATRVCLLQFSPDVDGEFHCTKTNSNLCACANIQFNMAELTKKAYGTTFVECRRIHLHANCRLRRVYFSDRIYADEDLPDDFKLFASDVPLKPGLYGVGSERRSDDKGVPGANSVYRKLQQSKGVNSMALSGTSLPSSTGNQHQLFTYDARQLTMVSSTPRLSSKNLYDGDLT